MTPLKVQIQNLQGLWLRWRYVPGSGHPWSRHPWSVEISRPGGGWPGSFHDYLGRGHLNDGHAMRHRSGPSAVMPGRLGGGGDQQQQQCEVLHTSIVYRQPSGNQRQPPMTPWHIGANRAPGIHWAGNLAALATMGRLLGVGRAVRNDTRRPGRV